MQVDFQYLFGWTNSDQVNLWNGLITSVCALGSAIGSLVAGPPAEKFGKLKSMHITNILVIIGCALTCIQNEYVILIGRFIFGFAAGAFSVFVPSFINELSPTEMKGSLGSLTQILITLGIFLSNLFGLPLPESIKDPIADNFINNNYWRIVNAIPILFAVG
jgi:MFS family permease